MLGALGMAGMHLETARCPWWYPLLLEADRLHCPPWTLLGLSEISVFWRDVAHKAIAAENGARNDLRAMTLRT